MTGRIPRRDEISSDTPLRLDVAAALAFPDGSMTGRGLRREAARGRLAVERIVGKLYVTLNAINEMRVLCRQEAVAQGSGSDPRVVPFPGKSPTMPSGSSSTENIKKALDAATTIVEGLSRR